MLSSTQRPHNCSQSFIDVITKINSAHLFQVAVHSLRFAGASRAHYTRWICLLPRVLTQAELPRTVCLENGRVKFTSAVWITTFQLFEKLKKKMKREKEEEEEEGNKKQFKRIKLSLLCCEHTGSHRSAVKVWIFKKKNSHFSFYENSHIICAGQTFKAPAAHPVVRCVFCCDKSMDAA
jgi:hypothetical protein